MRGVLLRGLTSARLCAGRGGQLNTAAGLSPPRIFINVLSSPLENPVDLGSAPTVKSHCAIHTRLTSKSTYVTPSSFLQPASLFSARFASSTKLKLRLRMVMASCRVILSHLSIVRLAVLDISERVGFAQAIGFLIITLYDALS